MNQPHSIHLSSWARLVGLALLLGVGLLASLGLASGTVHAATSLTVTNCSNDSQLQADVNTANSDNDNDTITFSCNGAIPLTRTLLISGSMTLDGSGQQVTLDGQHQQMVLLVNSGVTLTLNALTIANGSFSAPFESGGINNDGTLSISNSTFSGNSGEFGGGISNSGTLSISNSTFSGNSVRGGGGGISNDPFSTASISNSTFSGNSAGRGGGGINFGTLSISNSTFSGNSAFIEGGGIDNSGTLDIGGSIVANNSGGNCSGGVSDQGYNLESATDCGFTGTGDLQNTDPKLDPNGLQNNGGPTQTIALLATSPAIDHIPAANCPATDQRGVTRLPGERCDIGAFEFPDTTPPTLHLPGTITVNATSPQGAVVSYTATATDDDGDALVATCAPASGSTFPIGTTTVNCSASEPGSDTATGSFQVVVKGAAAQVSDLITTVNSFGLPADIQAGFDTQLQAVQTDLTNNNPAQACSDLTAFINHVQAQSGKHLTMSQANQLIAAAKQVQAVLGC